MRTQNVTLVFSLLFIVLAPCIFTSTASLTPQNIPMNVQRYSYVITGCPSATTAGHSFNGFTVTVYNSNGKIANGYCGKIYFTSTDAIATLPYTSQHKYTFTTTTNGDKGVHTFSGFNLATAGSQTITVTDGTITATTNVIYVNPSTPTAIQISPKTASVTAGLKQAYSAKATDYYGNSWDVTQLTSWSITTGAYGSWSGNAYTTAQVGSWTITGTYMGFHDTASIIVNHSNLTRIAVDPKNAVVVAGVPTVFHATAFDSFGNSWDVSNLSLWTIDSSAGGSWLNNSCTCTKNGVWTVTAFLSGLSDTASLDVTHNSATTMALSPTNPTSSAGSSIAFTSTAFDAYGNSWLVTDLTVWNIDSAAGGYWTGNIYHCSKVGTWKVTGVLGSLSNATVLTVGYTSMFSIAVSPKTVSVIPNSTISFTATASDIYGNIWDVTNLSTWSIDSNAAGTWVGSKYTSAMAGNWTAKAVYRGMSDTATLTVVHASPCRVALGSNASSAMAGSKISLSATAFDSFSNPWDISSSTSWSINSSAEGVWNQNIYTCAKAGNWQITGVYQGFTVSLTLLVSAGSPVSLSISFTNGTVTAGTSQTYLATALDYYNNSWDITNSVSWSITGDAGGYWANNVYTPARAGTWIVTAKFGILITTSNLIVSHGTATKVLTELKTANVVAGSPQTFSAIAIDSFGNSWNITNSLTINPDPQSEGLLSGNIYTCFSAGNWTITIRCQNLFDTVLLVVTHSAPVSITVSSLFTSMVAGYSQPYVSTASDTYGNLWDVTGNTNWNISAGSGGSWNGNVYTSQVAGNWVIAGEYLGLSDYTYLTVIHTAAVKIKIFPNIANVTAGSAEAFTATAFDYFNNTWSVSTSVTWSIENDAGGSWTGNVYTSDNAGNWIINASIDGLNDTASIMVNHGAGFKLTIHSASTSINAGSSNSFTASASDFYGNTWDVTDLTTWSIDSAASGNWLGNTYVSCSAGKNWAVTGTFLGLSSRSSLTVNHGEAVNITLSSTSSTVTAGSSIDFITTACDAWGNTWDVTPATSWTSNPDAGGSWSGNMLTCELSGTWCINATFERFIKSIYITVIHNSPVSISINSFNDVIAAGLPEAYSAIAVDNFGNSWDITPLTVWSADSSAGGSWENNVYCPERVGTWNISATVNSLSALTSLTVVHASASSLTITPQILTTQSGAKVSFEATAIDISGNSWNATSSISWFIDNKAGGSWLGNTYSASNAGTWIVTGEISGITGTTYLTVNHGTLQVISITAQSTSLNVGANQIFTATAVDASGNSWDVTNSVNWAVYPISAGSWASNIFTPLIAGNWTVNASFNGTVGATQITILNSSQPNPLDLNVDGFVNFQDIAYFISGYISYGQYATVNPVCDFNHDSKVDFQDLVLFLPAYIAYLQRP